VHVLQQQLLAKLGQIPFRLLRFVVRVNCDPFAALGFWIDRIQIDGDLSGEVLLDDLLRQAAYALASLRSFTRSK